MKKWNHPNFFVDWFRERFHVFPSLNCHYQFNFLFQVEEISRIKPISKIIKSEYDSVKKIENNLWIWRHKNKIILFFCWPKK